MLLDGNIGIGGAPTRLLMRVRGLLADGGEVLVELESPDTAPAQTRAYLESPYGTSAWFPWARVAAPDIAHLAAATGFRVSEQTSERGRWFARLVYRARTAVDVASV